MKTIPLKSVTIDANGKPIEMTYGELIKSCLNNPPQGGFSIQDIRKRNRILDALEAGGEDTSSFDLEDEDAKTLQACVDKMSWAIMDRAILAFADDVALAVKGEAS